MERYASYKKSQKYEFATGKYGLLYRKEPEKTIDSECVQSILSQNYIFCICLGGGRDSSAATIIMHE